MPNLEGFMRLALQAQSQCRATLETLVAIKDPPVVCARQANITTGPQQVNWISRGENEITPNQVSTSAEVRDELLPAARPSSDAGRNDQTLEALAEVHRAKVATG